MSTTLVQRKEQPRPPQPRLATAHAALRALRPHQWAKNVLVFAAPALAHHIDAATFARGAVAFVAFDFAASSAYVLNDLLDAEQDRKHPRKRLRPIAARTLPVPVAIVMVPALLAAGIGAALPLPRAFLLLLCSYYAATIAYSTWLKRKVVLDVLVLAGLYTLRLYGGALAANVPVSEWLASLSMFFFLSLALLKRASELVALRSDAPGRGYQGADCDQVFSLGAASGYIAVLVLALYVSSPDVARLYSEPRRLWLLCPLALYWVSRLWIYARRGKIHDDPLVHAFRDRVTYAVGAAAIAIVYLAT